MSQSKLKNLIYIQQRKLRFIILLLGVSVSIFALSSNFNENKDSDKALKGMDVLLVENDLSPESQVIKAEMPIPETKPKLKMHHNFIVSYLFQESSFERKNNNSEGHTDFVSSLKQMHKVIINHTLGKI